MQLQKWERLNSMHTDNTDQFAVSVLSDNHPYIPSDPRLEGRLNITWPRRCVGLILICCGDIFDPLVKNSEHDLSTHQNFSTPPINALFIHLFDRSWARIQMNAHDDQRKTPLLLHKRRHCQLAESRHIAGRCHRPRSRDASVRASFSEAFQAMTTWSRGVHRPHLKGRDEISSYDWASAEYRHKAEVLTMTGNSHRRKPCVFGLRQMTSRPAAANENRRLPSACCRPRRRRGDSLGTVLAQCRKPYCQLTIRSLLSTAGWREPKNVEFCVNSFLFVKVNDIFGLISISMRCCKK